MANGAFEFAGTKRFEIRRELGAGGMGVVYEAYDRELCEPVALKTLRDVGGQTLYRLKNEFRGLQGLQHPNLVRLGELIEDGGRWFFTMELVDGADFLSYVRGPGHDPRSSTTEAYAPTDVALAAPTPSDAPLAAAPVEAPAGPAPPVDEPRLRAVLRQLALGVAALHGAGKVHRDIKPSNIRVTPEGRLVLLDFGLITDAVASRQAKEGVVGTAAYMAPEQAAAKPVGPAADWYAVGVLLFEALTGRLPFTGTSLQIVMDKQRIEPPPPRAFAPDAPDDLDALCRGLLRHEPSARPSAREVVRRLGADEADASAFVSTTLELTEDPPLVGRDDELARLDAALAATANGEPRAVVLEGESGVGKSALIRRFAADAASGRHEAVVLAGRCFERESVPYKAIDGVVDALAGYLRGLSKPDAAALMPRAAALLPDTFPVLASVEAVARAPSPPQDVVDPIERRNRVFGALRELLERIAERHALVLIVDDAQWADADSIALLRELVRPPDAPPMLLVIAARAGATDDVVAALPRPPQRIDLAPLSADAARRLARLLMQRFDAPRGASAALIAVEARGHPLYIDELVRHAALAAGDGQERRLEDALWARISSLDPTAARVLELVAVAEAPLPFETVRRAAELEVAELARHVALLRVSNFVRGGADPRDSVLEPYHNRVREAVLDHLDPVAARPRHERLAVALETQGGAREQPELLVHHLRGAGQAARAAHFARAAASRARRALAFDRAADLYRTALELGDPDDADRRDLQIAMADALANAGRGAAAADAYLAAADGADAATRLSCRRLAAYHLLISGHIERGRTALREVLAQVGVRYPATAGRAMASLLWQKLLLSVRGYRWTETDVSDIAPRHLTRLDVYRSAVLGLSMVDPVRSTDFQVRGLRLALRIGERRHAVRALAEYAVVLAASGPRGARRGRAVLAQATATAEASGDPYLIALVTGADASHCYVEGNYPLALEKIRTAERLFLEQTAGTWGEVSISRTLELLVLRRTGAYAELGERGRIYLRDAQQRGDRYQETLLRRACNAVYLAHDGLDEARRQLERAPWASGGDTFHLQDYWTLVARADQSIYAGIDDPLAAAAGDFAAFHRSLLHLAIDIARIEARWLRGRLALATAERAPDPAAALRVARRCARRIDRRQPHYPAAWAALLRAGVASLRGRPDAAASELRHAIERADACNLEQCGAAARYRLAAIVGGDEGDALRAAAVRWFDAQGVVDRDQMCRVIAPGFAPRRALAGGTRYALK